jgi:hypothetical protein
MTKPIPNNGKNRPVNKRIIFSAVFVVVIMLGSFCLRELFAENHIIQKLFGGINILVFWVVSCAIFHKIENWIFGKNINEDKNRDGKEKRIVLSKRILFFSLVVCVSFFVSLRYLDGWRFILFWLIFVAFLLIGNLLVKQRGVKN